MEKGNLTKRERSLLHDLLSQKGIYKYTIIDACGEGKSLPGSTYPCEIESMSGYVVTEDVVYSFWLDWHDNHYTLGEEEYSEGRTYWKEIEVNTSRIHQEIIQIQEQLKNSDSIMKS